MTEIQKLRKELRTAVADYKRSEGCSCCQSDNHDENLAVIAKLLNVPMYDDKSGYDFGKYESKS